ncbi:hypothetical protein HZC07_03895 [Candidatus Micrarchaeota archaeon]|nr:hypothetical protein [Candidatus Micrarchaeota archaeon]
MELASELMCAKTLSRSALVRFHGDADGISAAFAITSILPYAKAYQQNSAVYTVRDAFRDFSAIGQESNPLVIFVDFGSSESSSEGIKILNDGGVEVIVIDHHPSTVTSSDFRNAKIFNPFSLSEDGSRYPAGYLCAEIAFACGFLAKDKALELAKISCAGDKSKILDPLTQSDIEKALVLDFVSAHTSFGNNLDFYKNVMAKDELFRSLFKQAEESISEAAKKAMDGMKSTKIKIENKPTDVNQLEIISFSLDRIVTKGEWPPSGKITTRVFDILNEEAKSTKPILVIGYNERSIIMRLNDSAVALGVTANILAEKMLAAMPDFVEGGGGHDRAGAIRVRSGFVKDVLGQLMAEIS